MNEVTIYDEKSGDNEHHLLKVILKETGDLVMEGYDCGDSVKEFWGDFDYEYWLTVKEQNVSAVLLWLIKERFKSSSEFKTWLEDKKIEFEFQNWI
jgi:hypothetical protein